MGARGVQITRAHNLCFNRQRKKAGRGRRYNVQYDQFHKYSLIDTPILFALCWIALQIYLLHMPCTYKLNTQIQCEANLSLSADVQLYRSFKLIACSKIQENNAFISLDKIIIEALALQRLGKTFFVPKWTHWIYFVPQAHKTSHKSITLLTFQALNSWG